MRFFSILLTGASLMGAAIAQSTQVFFTDVPTSVTVGTPVTLKYTAVNPNTPVTITLRKGPAGNLGTVQVLTSSSTGGSFTFTPDRTLVNGADYAFQITQGTENNFSGQFSLTGSTATANPTVASGSTAATSGTGTTVTATLRSNTPSGSSTTGTPATSGTPSASTPTGSSTPTTPTTTSTRTSSASSQSTSAAPSNAAGMTGSSPVALILGAVAAMAYLN